MKVSDDFNFLGIHFIHINVEKLIHKQKWLYMNRKVKIFFKD